MKINFKKMAMLITSIVFAQHTYAADVIAEYDGTSLNELISGHQGSSNISDPFGPGRCGSSFDFPDGSGGYVSTQIGNVGTDDFTLSVWVQTTATGREPIFDNYYGSGVQWELVDGKQKFSIRGNGGPSISRISSTEFVADGEWHHVMVSVDRNVGVKFYVDGALTGTENSVGSISSQTGSINTWNNGNAKIGATYFWPASGLPTFDGMVDGLKIFRGVETPDSIMPEEACPLDPNGNVVDWFNGQSYLNVGRDGQDQHTYEANVYGDVFLSDGQCTDGYHFNAADDDLSNPYKRHGDYMIAPSVFPDNGEGDFTISLWVRVNDDDLGGDNLQNGKLQYLLDKPDAFVLYVNEEGKLVFQMSGSEPGNYNYTRITSSMKVSSSVAWGIKWRHVIVSVDRDLADDGIKVYIDGLLSATGDPTNLQGDVGAGDMAIGSPINYPVRASSSMDEIKIYTTALEPHEVNRTEPCPSVNLSDLDCGVENDLIIAEDASASFFGYRQLLKDQFPGITHKLLSFDSEAKIGLVSFIDRPGTVWFGFEYFGESLYGDYLYNVESTLTNDADQLHTALNGMYSGGNGGDNQEASLEAMFYSAVKQSELDYRSGSKRTVMVTTDNEYHYQGKCQQVNVCNRENDGDEVAEDDEEIPTYDQLATVLNDENVTPVFVVPEHKKSYYNTLLTELSNRGVTGGKVLTLEGGRENFHEVVFEALGCVEVP